MATRSNNLGSHKYSIPPSSASKLSFCSSRQMSSKMKPLIIFVALWIPAVYCRAQLAGWNSINHRHVGDPVEVKEVKKDQKASEKHEAVGLPLEKISKVISDHPVEGPKLKDEETVLLDSIRDELVEVENELKDVKTHLTETEDVEKEPSQTDPNGMALPYSSFVLTFIFFHVNSNKV